MERESKEKLSKLGEKREQKISELKKIDASIEEIRPKKAKIYGDPIVELSS